MADAGGEYIRSDVTESQQGIPLWMDVAVFDVDTCQPVVGKWMEIWGMYHRDILLHGNAVY